MPFKSDHDSLNNGMITLDGTVIASRTNVDDWGLNTKLPTITFKKTDPLSIKKVIFHGPATVIYWSDGTKTVVKCKNEEFDKEKGLAMACMKKLLGNKGHYYEEVKKWVNTK